MVTVGNSGKSNRPDDLKIYDLDDEASGPVNEGTIISEDMANEKLKLGEALRVRDGMTGEALLQRIGAMDGGEGGGGGTNEQVINTDEQVNELVDDLYKANNMLKKFQNNHTYMALPTDNKLLTCIVVLLNLIIINKRTIDKIVEKLKDNKADFELNKDNNTLKLVLYKILVFLIFIDKICNNNYLFNEEVTVENTNIENLICKILNNSFDNMASDNIYELSNAYSWSSKTQHISKSEADMAKFIYETIIYIISGNEEANIISIDTTTIRIKKEYMNKRLYNKIKNYNENITNIEAIRDDIILDYFKKICTESNDLNDLNEIKKTREKIETYGNYSSGVYIKIPSEDIEGYNEYKKNENP